jgi:predicted nucleic acid-binding protein
MKIILDTSAAIEVVLGRSYSKQIIERLSNADWVIAPDVYIAEVTNVFWKYYQFGDLSIESCKKGIENALSIVDDIISSKELHQEAFALSCLGKQPVYDTLFLVLARRNNGILLTLDKKLSKLARKNSIIVE